jgi:TatD DNase family protein
LTPLFDTHCHLDDAAFDQDRPELMARAQAAGVVGVVVPGVQPSSWARLCTLGKRFGWQIGLGIHPCVLPALASEERYFRPDSLAGISAIGECGLDGGVPVAMAIQEQLLCEHLSIAKDTGLPVILHGYRCHDRLLPLLKRFAPLQGVLHSYSGGAQLVPAYVKLGLHLSFAGAITWLGARKPIESLLAVPAERLLAETDSPDQCPKPSPTPPRSEPCMLPQIIARMEEIRKEPLKERLAQNASTLFPGFRQSLFTDTLGN